MTACSHRPLLTEKTAAVFSESYTRAALSAVSTRAFRNGMRRSRTPVASKIAFPTAAISGLQIVSPAP
jgi:hypothetical protein